MTIQYPEFAKNRGAGFWLRSANLWASRRSYLRSDRSNDLRYTFGEADPIDRSVPFSKLLPPGRDPDAGFRFLILGDTGEGDRSQYGLLPLIRAMKADFMIIVGDLANPAGRIHSIDRNRDDYLAGFFEPYRGFDRPIWSVPGNHEYYSPGEGREYFDTFCSLKFADRWNEYGLRFVPQPGTFWELSDLRCPLVVIGLDTGKSGNLDGKRFLARSRPDNVQHAWLEERLQFTDRDKKKVVVLLHIPALSQGGKKKETHLETLYRLLAAHDSVQTVICGHDHNFQRYDADTFRQFLEENMHLPAGRNIAVSHITNGGGGSGLHPTSFLADPKYRPVQCYPDLQQWNDYAHWGKKMTSWTGLARTPIGFLVGKFEDYALTDADAARYLSFLLVEVHGKDSNWDFSICPVFMDNVASLYAQPDIVVDVTAAAPPPDPGFVNRCMQPLI